MEKIAEDFEDKDVVFFMLYTREPHAEQKMGKWDFSEKKQTETHKERVDYALEMIKEYTQKRPVLIDVFGEDCLQNKIGGDMPNSLIVVDKEGKLVLWQVWSNAEELRAKLEEMTETEEPEAETEKYRE